jgi:hypothetical protein
MQILFSAVISQTVAMKKFGPCAIGLRGSPLRSVSGCALGPLGLLAQHSLNLTHANKRQD